MKGRGGVRREVGRGGVRREVVVCGEYIMYQFPVASVVKGDESSFGGVGLAGAVPHVLVGYECAIHSFNLVRERKEGVTESRHCSSQTGNAPQVLAPTAQNL